MNKSMMIPSMILIAILVAGCQSNEPAAVAPSPQAPSTSTTAAETPEGALPVVEAGLVCMINNRYFGSPQIPVEVEDKTYYGCCANCEKTLKQDPTSRVATDPQSGEEVDKASAVILKLDDGNVRYFANRENASTFWASR